jgi:hypothetical protein
MKSQSTFGFWLRHFLLSQRINFFVLICCAHQYHKIIVVMSSHMDLVWWKQKIAQTRMACATHLIKTSFPDFESNFSF